MAWYDSLLWFAGFIVVVFAFIAIASARDPTIRHKVSVISKDGSIDSFWVNKKILVRENGTVWYKHHGNRYHATGPMYRFTYRMVRSFGMRKYIGLQRIFLEGNPSPFVFEEDKRMAILRDTARMLGHAADSDLPVKLLRPRKVDMVLLLLVGFMALAIGYAIRAATENGGG